MTLKSSARLRASSCDATGRDDNNRLSALANVDGDLVPFVLPVWFQDSRNYFIINDKLGNGYLIDGKLYSVAQVTRVLKNIEEGTHKSAIGGYTKLTKNIGLKALFGFAMVGILPFGLEKIESLINPAHSMAYDSGMRNQIFCRSDVFCHVTFAALWLGWQKPGCG